MYIIDRRGEFRDKKQPAIVPGSKSIEQVVRCTDVLFLDFIEQCLQWDPMKRLTPERAFQHEWISTKDT